MALPAGLAGVLAGSGLFASRAGMAAGAYGHAPRSLTDIGLTGAGKVALGYGVHQSAGVARKAHNKRNQA